jgi:TRAP-type uncharacterized transport system substrate-binding protein
MFAAMVMMVSGVAAHAEPIDYNPAESQRQPEGDLQFGSVSTKKALNANTVTLLTGTIGGTYVQFGADLAPCSTTTVTCASCRSSVEVRCRASPTSFS